MMTKQQKLNEYNTFRKECKLKGVDYSRAMQYIRKDIRTSESLEFETMREYIDKVKTLENRN